MPRGVENPLKCKFLIRLSCQSLTLSTLLVKDKDYQVQVRKFDSEIVEKKKISRLLGVIVLDKFERPERDFDV